MQSNIFQIENLQLPEKFTIVQPYSFSLQKKLLALNDDGASLLKSGSDGAESTPEATTSQKFPLLCCHVNNMKQLWIWGEIPNHVDLDRIFEESSNQQQDASKSSHFHTETHSFDTFKHMKYALLSLKCYYYYKLSKQYSIYNQFVTVQNNLGFEMDFVWRDHSFFVHVEVMEWDFDGNTQKPRHHGMHQSLNTGATLDSLQYNDGVNGAPAEGNRWVVTPFGIPAKVVRYDSKHVHVKISTLNQRVVAFRTDEVRPLSHVAPTENNGKILDKIFQILKMSGKDQKSILNGEVKQHSNGGATQRYQHQDSVSHQQASTSTAESSRATQNGGTHHHTQQTGMSQSSRDNNRKRKRQFIESTSHHHSQQQASNRESTRARNGTSTLKKSDSRVPSVAQQTLNKKRKTCRDIFQAFRISTDSNKSVVLPSSIGMDPDQYEALASFLVQMESPPASVENPNAKIPDFSETEQEQLTALHSYFPKYEGDIPTTTAYSSLDDSLAEEDVMDVRAAEEIEEDDFDALWDEEEEKTNQNDVKEEELQAAAKNAAEEQKAQKLREHKAKVNKQILDFYSEQSKAATNSFVESMDHDNSDVMSDSCPILNAPIKEPTSEPLLFPPNPFSADNAQEGQTTSRNDARSNHIFSTPKAFQSEKFSATNSDNLVFSLSSYMPEYLVDAGDSRFCSVSNYMQRIEVSARNARTRDGPDTMQSKDSSVLPSFLDTVSSTRKSHEHSATVDDSDEVFVREPSLLETLYLHMQVLGKGKRSSSTSVQNLLHKTRFILSQCSPGEERLSSLLLFGEFSEQSSSDVLSNESSSVLQSQPSNNFELVRIHALSESISSCARMKSTSGEKIVSVLAHMKDELTSLPHTSLQLKGPLLLEDHALSVAQVVYPSIPLLRMGYTDQWLDASPEAMSYWEKMLLQPFAPSKRLRYLMITHSTDPDQNRHFSDVLRDLSSVFRLCQLGSHSPVRSGDHIKDGMFHMDLNALSTRAESVDSLKHFFVTAFQSKIRETMIALKKYINSAAEKDEIIVIYFVNPLPELLTRIILQTLEIPTDEWPVVFHVIDEEKLNTVYQRNPLEELKELAMEIFNKCRSSKKWSEESPYFSRMYEPALVLSPSQLSVSSSSSSSSSRRQRTPNQQLNVDVESPNYSSQLSMHLAYRMYDSKYVICTWTDSNGQLLESSIYSKASSTSSWMSEACKKSRMFLNVSPHKSPVNWSIVLCKYGSQISDSECQEWKQHLSDSKIDEMCHLIRFVSLQLDSSLQLLLDSARLHQSRSSTQNSSVDSKLYPKEKFHGSVLVVPTSCGVSVDGNDQILNGATTFSANGNDNVAQKTAQKVTTLSECHLLSSLSINPFDSTLSRSINVDMQRFESYVTRLHGEIGVKVEEEQQEPEDMMIDGEDGGSGGSGGGQGSFESIASICDEMHKLSWLSCSPSYPQRKSILPIHIQLIDRIEHILREMVMFGGNEEETASRNVQEG